MTIPTIFDRRLLRRRRARAAAGFDAHDFLHRKVAVDIVDRLESVTRPFPRMLILGAARGVLTDALTTACGVGEIIQADFAPAMTPAGGYRLVADEEALPFARNSFDLVVSMLSLHTINDLPGALAQIRGALKPDGLFIGALFAGRTLSELRQSFAQAESDLLGGAGPRVAPFVDIRDAGALLQRAGFSMPVADIDRMTVSYVHPLKLFAELRGMGETTILTERRRKPDSKALFQKLFQIYQSNHSDGQGRIQATFEIMMLTGWAPHGSQPRPLEPGSATVSLADAVKTQD